MYQIRFYKDKNGNSPVKDHLDALLSRSDKDSRINANKILECFAHLKRFGHRAKEPYAKNLGKSGIWELRPVRGRILYTAWNGNIFILLHIFMKDTQKTPIREIKQAERFLGDIKGRGLKDATVE